MQPYWIKFERCPRRTALDLGVGVTARSEDDARALVRVAFPQCEIASLTLVEDAAALDQGHVTPNIGNILARGIWFPLGYDNVADTVR